MTLHSTLTQTIAALDRITCPDPDSISTYADDEKSIYRGAVSLTSASSHREGRSIRHRSSEPSLRQSKAYSEKAPWPYQASMSSQAGEDPEYVEPKINFKYVAKVTFDFSTVVLSFVCPAIGICIIGLAADNINWGTGRGTQVGSTVNAVVVGSWNATDDTVEFWDILMKYLPVSAHLAQEDDYIFVPIVANQRPCPLQIHYDTTTFVALIVAGVAATLGSFIAAPLSVLHWRSTGRSVKLGRKSNVSHLIQCSPMQSTFCSQDYRLRSSRFCSLVWLSKHSCSSRRSSSSSARENSSQR